MIPNGIEERESKEEEEEEKEKEDRRCTIPVYLSVAGGLWKFVEKASPLSVSLSPSPSPLSLSLDTMIGGFDTLSNGAPVSYVSALPPSSSRSLRGDGSLAEPLLNMEESEEISIRRVRSGLLERISLSCKLLSLRRLGF